MACCVSVIYVGVRSAVAQGIRPYLQDQVPATMRVLLEDSVVQKNKHWWESILSYGGIKSDVRKYPKIGSVFHVVSSAYAPNPRQTDATPCITASGTMVRQGVVATNFLPLGTIVSIEDKRYIVEDRMNSRYDGHYMDIWFPSTSEALIFGRKKLEVTILGYGKPGDSIEVPTSEPVVEQKKPFWRSVADSLGSLGQFLTTKTFSDKDIYDVDCFE